MPFRDLLHRRCTCIWMGRNYWNILINIYAMIGSSGKFLLCSNIFFPDFIFSYTSGLKLKSIFLIYATALIPLTFYIKNFYWHTNKLNIKLKTWFNFCTCIVNSETKLPTIIEIHFYCIITVRLKFKCYKSCR